MLVLRLSSLFLAAFGSNALSIPRGIEGGGPFDQFRFMDCERGALAGYYYAPPMKDDKPGYTLRLRNTPKDHTWRDTHLTTYSRTDSNGYRFDWELRHFPLTLLSFKQYVGNVTFRGEGFNCFGDDNHAVHVDAEFGQCSTAIFCIHREATIINFSASRDVVSWGSHKSGPMQPPDFAAPQEAVRTIMAKVRGAQTGPMTCDSSVIDIGGDCSMVVSCDSSDVTGEALKGLIDTMVDTYRSEKDLYKPVNTGSCGGTWGTTCHWFRGVTIPARYRLATVNVAPPGGDGSLPPVAPSSLQAKLTVDVTCGLKDNDGGLCGALSFLAAGGAAGAGSWSGAGPVFGTFGALVVAACS
jgi:hypothetical protein